MKLAVVHRKKFYKRCKLYGSSEKKGKGNCITSCLLNGGKYQLHYISIKYFLTPDGCGLVVTYAEKNIKSFIKLFVFFFLFFLKHGSHIPSSQPSFNGKRQ